MASAPLNLAVVNDYQLVVTDVAKLLAPFSDRVQVIDLDTDTDHERRADVALLDLFGTTGTTVMERCRQLRRANRIGHILLYTTAAPSEPELRAEALGADGVVLKSAPAEQVVAAVEAISAGAPEENDAAAVDRLSSREREILGLMATGRTNREIARTLYVSEETVKTYAKRLFRELGVRNRVEAAIRAAELGVVAR